MTGTRVLPFILLLLLALPGAAQLKGHDYDLSPAREPCEFIWNPPDNDYLARMRKECGLEEMVAGAADDFGRVRIVTAWVSNLWEHHGSNRPEKKDPLSILEEARAGKRFRCVEYSIVMNGALNALGIPSRVLGLKKRNVQWALWGAGHVVVEAYLRDLRKWVMADGQWDAIPVLAEKPLSAIEFQQALAGGAPDLRIATSSGTGAGRYFRWIKDYLYYFDTPLDTRVGVDNLQPGSLMLIPLGAKEPKRFQIFYPIKNMLFTNSVAAFYPTPPAPGKGGQGPPL